MSKATQKTMKAIVLDHFGDSETMKLPMLPVPEVGPDEARLGIDAKSYDGMPDSAGDRKTQAHGALDKHSLGKLVLQTA